MSAFLIIALFVCGFWAGRQSTAPHRRTLQSIYDQVTDYRVSRESLRTLIANHLYR